MSGVSSIPKLTTGYEVTNLILRDHMWGPPHPVFVYNVDNTPVNAITGKEEFHNERDINVLVYSPILPFFINPDGKQIIAVYVGVKQEPYLDVILYQEDEYGKLYRLTSISNKILRGCFVFTSKPLNHPLLKLTQYSEQDESHYVNLASRITILDGKINLKNIEDELLRRHSNTQLEIKNGLVEKELSKNELHKREVEKITDMNVKYTSFIFSDVFGFSSKRLSSL